MLKFYVVVWAAAVRPRFSRKMRIKIKERELMKVYRILSINPGSTSTKIGVFDNEALLFEEVIRHSKEDLDQYGSIMEQKDMRLKLLLELIEKHGIGLETIDAFVGRGGIIAPLASGVYPVNERMLHDLQYTSATRHASALGGIFAHELGARYGKPSYIVDPVVVDERIPVARITGIPGLERLCVFHALNQKAVARQYARDNHKRYEDCSLVVAHLGGGISVGAHFGGRVVDVSDGINGEGPFSPERCGAIQADPLIRLCFSGKYTESELLAFVSKRGGVSAHLNTTDMRECEKMLDDGDERAKLVFESMAYNVAKTIGAMLAALQGKAEAVILTGGVAYSKRFTSLISRYVGDMAPIVIYPGEDELKALAQGALRVLSGEEEPREYVG